ncbi:MAG: stage V sporulation protein AD [Clostridia bacterium]|nr:stage V sporulation protein AD [Clostridia bacterium]
MSKKKGSTVFLENKPRILETASIAGQKESEGPLGCYFDCVITDGRFNEKSWEKAESKMQRQAVGILLEKTKKANSDIDFIFGGDLLNQCVGTSFGLLDYSIPFFGLYGACSTFCEGLCLSAMAVDGGFAHNVIAVTSSHFCSSERQFRFPLEYGGQRTPSAQWTVTASGAAMVCADEGNFAITAITPGKIVDKGIKDANNMGAAMAPAAVDTLIKHFTDRQIDENYYDLVITGDLGVVGSSIVSEQLENAGLVLGNRYTDCGKEIFDIEKQDVHAGGSGCGCCASVFSGYIFKKMQEGNLNKVLVCATGALMSTTSTFQGDSIPGVAHAVAVERI